jgi:hypothetical protein
MYKKHSVFILLIVLIMPLKGQENSPEAQAKSSSPFDQSKFVPDISLIADFSYVARDLKDDRFFFLGIPGLGAPLDLSGDQGNALGGSNVRRGFNLNYGEMSLYSVVDPYFDLFAVLHMTPDHAGLEEAYMTTRKLPYGFRIKAGKFLSGIGRINDQHEHTWDFADRPLVSQAFFGEEGLNEIGAQITWVAPIDLYLMLSAEILNGDNEVSFGTAGFSDPGGNVNIQNNSGPGLIVGYVRSAFDLGDATFLTGLSYAHGTTRADKGFSGTEGVASAIDGTTNIANGNITVKYILDPIRSISFQSEYFYRLTDGKIYDRDSSNKIQTSTLNKHQAGFYSQLAAKLDLSWRIAVRYDLINLNEVYINTGGINIPTDLTRYSAMIEYNPTEFSRLRLQLNHDLSKYIAVLTHEPYSEIILQFNVAIGAHGAHPF